MKTPDVTGGKDVSTGKPNTATPVDIAMTQGVKGDAKAGAQPALPGADKGGAGTDRGGTGTSTATDKGNIAAGDKGGQPQGDRGGSGGSGLTAGPADKGFGIRKMIHL